MRPLLFAALLPLAAAAQDPLDSPACRSALQALSAQEAGGDRARLESARRQAARACLGAKADPAPAPRRTQPPVAVPSAMTPPRALPVPAPMPPAPATPRALPPPTVTSCDAVSCLTSDGQRLNRSGAGLVGPAGTCSVQAGVVICP